MVPNGWRYLCLKDLLDGPIKNGFSPNAAGSDTGYWVLGLGALGDEGINSSEIKPVLPEEKVIQCLLREDDFLVSRSNTPDKVGRSIRYKGEIKNCSYPDLMMRFRIDEQKADKVFIEQQLKSSIVRMYFRNCAAGSSGTMVKINKGILEKTPIATPPIPEQKKIAQILSTWDKAITATEQLLANSLQQKKSLMQQLLTGKKRLLDKNGVRFSGEWKNGHLSDLGKISKGKALSSKDLVDGDYPVIAGGKSSPYNHRDFTHENVITVSASGAYAGYVSYHPYKLWASDCSVVIAKANSNTCFIYQLMSHMQSKIYSLQSGGAQPHVYPKDLEVLRVSIPPREEQQKIADVLSTADQEISTLQQKLDALKQEKRALMQQLLTGKRRVTLAGSEQQDHIYGN